MYLTEEDSGYGLRVYVIGACGVEFGCIGIRGTGLGSRVCGVGSGSGPQNDHTAGFF